MKTVLILLIFLLHLQAEADSHRDFRISGWSEMVQSVSDLEVHRKMLEEIAGWEVISAGPVERETLSAWHLDDSITADEMLMGNPGSIRGYIRLIQFKGARQSRIRSNAQTWESGGILDINVRVLDMQTKSRQMQDAGWQGHSDPVRFVFGPFEVVEWIGVGPDDLSFALIERREPKLDGWPNIREFSRAFNSTQVVRDMPAALYFYRDVLGFQTYLHHVGSSEEAGPNVLGLPHNLASTIEREVWILHPDGVNEGSVELLYFNGIHGRDFSDRARPPKLGMLMLRFPVSNLDALVQHLQSHEIILFSEIGISVYSHWGKTRQFSVLAPDGAMLEFYETVDDG